MKNLTQLQAALLTRAGNLDPSDPVWTGSNSGTDLINEAQDMLVMRVLNKNRAGLDLFRELEDRWLAKEQTNVQYLDLGTRVLTIDEVYSFDDSTTADPGPNENLAKRRELRPINNRQYETFPRVSTPAGWPISWRRFEKRLYMVPTPGAGYESWLLIVGKKLPKQLDFTDPSSTPILADIWEAALEDYSAYFLFKRLGWDTDAQAALVAGDTAVANMVDPRGLERGKSRVKLRPKGMPK